MVKYGKASIPEDKDMYGIATFWTMKTMKWWSTSAWSDTMILLLYIFFDSVFWLILDSLIKDINEINVVVWL